jgi:hypothetical protein
VAVQASTVLGIKTGGWVIRQKKHWF